MRFLRWRKKRAKSKPKLVRYPMLRRTFRYHINGALEPPPCIGLQLNLLLFGGFTRSNINSAN